MSIIFNKAGREKIKKINESSQAYCLLSPLPMTSPAALCLCWRQLGTTCFPPLTLRLLLPVTGIGPSTSIYPSTHSLATRHSQALWYHFVSQHSLYLRRPYLLPRHHLCLPTRNSLDVNSIFTLPAKDGTCTALQPQFQVVLCDFLLFNLI